MANLSCRRVVTGTLEYWGGGLWDCFCSQLGSIDNCQLLDTLWHLAGVCVCVCVCVYLGSGLSTGGNRTCISNGENSRQNKKSRIPSHDSSMARYKQRLGGTSIWTDDSVRVMYHVIVCVCEWVVSWQWLLEMAFVCVKHSIGKEVPVS